ncbi:hypothetical protein BG006_010861 [Podila minutissima]|uniref:Uncharacterized protein n=1 Tax=Podila minutissima TaxID=64525 RepID=A0A9P5SGM7_9FUNG|nr:hypothetical protein BG006_010861 [Podila minutissima]
MPLLKRKAIKPVPPPDPNEFDANTPVYMMNFTNEIFTSYEDYVNRYFFYKQKSWQCETTGKSGLTYEEALESEHKEKSMVANKFPPQLRKPLLEFSQFQTTRIDAVVDDAFAHFKNKYYLNENVHVEWDNQTYSGVIRKVLPKEEWKEVKNGAESPDEPGQYLVQVLDEQGKGIKTMERVVDCSLLSRDRLAFNKNIIRKYIRECTTKESYIGAPWLVKPSLAKKFGIETKLPADLQCTRDLAIKKILKRKGTDPAPELAAAKKAKKEAFEKIKEETPTLPTVVEVKPVIKYPMEDLSLDAGALSKREVVARPAAQKETSVPQDLFESVIMSWQFLNTFGTPLKLMPFGIKAFEDSLSHTTVEPRSVMVAEYHSTLMNVIIQDRMNGLVKPVLATGSTTNTGSVNITRDDRESSVMTDNSTMDDGDLSIGDQDDYVHHERRKLAQRPINEQVVVVGQGWDARLVPSSRDGWEAVLVGLINELGSFEAIPNVDRILNHLVPDEKSTKDDVEYLFPSLPLEDKVSILVFLIETASGTSAIRHYMDDCREQLKGLRQEKIDLNREKRNLQAEKAEMERQDAINALSEKDNGLDQAVATPEASQPDSEADSIHSGRQNGDSLSRSESRQEKLKRQQLEREQEEHRKTQDILRQRAVNKAKSAEQKARLDARKKLHDQEHALVRREEQIDRDSRRCAVARIKPLGQDRFFNRYWYFDGVTSMHATDRIYIQSPSFLDLETVRTGSDMNKILARHKVEDPSGELESLLRSQSEEIGAAMVIEKIARVKKLQQERERETDSDNEEEAKASGNYEKLALEDQEFDETKAVEHKSSQWSYYSEPEQVDALLLWLNEKGVREHALIQAIEAQYDTIVRGMQAHRQEILNHLQKEQARRSTRVKTSQASEGYLGYVNKASK